MEKTIICPPVRIVRNVDFNRRKAQFLISLGLSGEGTIDSILNTLYENQSYRLVRPNGEVFDVGSEDPRTLQLLDNLFGEDAKRGVNRYKKRADGGYKNRLPMHLVPAVMLIYFTQKIHLSEIERQTKG